MKMKMLGVVGMLLAGTGLLHAQLRDPMPGWIYPAVAPNRAAAYDPPMDHYGYPTYPARQPVLAYPSDPAASPFVMPARQTGSGMSLVDEPVQSELVQVVPSEPAPTA